MTREEAIEHGKEQLDVFGGEHAEFIKLAIEALEQEHTLDEQLEAEIDWEKDWLEYTGYDSCTVGIAFDSIKHILDKVITEIDRERKWLSYAGYNACNVDIAFSSIKHSLRKGGGENE